MKFLNQYTNKPEQKGEVNTLPSKTIPDQAMTIREIINRTEKGLPVTGARVPLYNETEDGIMPDLRNMDISEIYELKKRIKETENQLRKDLQEAKEKQQQEEAEAFYRKKFGTPEIPLTPAEEIK